MKIKRVIRWSILNIFLAACAYLAVIEKNEGVARVYQFWMWFSSVSVFIAAFNDDLRAKFSKDGPAISTSLNGAIDMMFCLFFIYHGWWLTGIASVIGAIGNSQLHEPAEK